jgi:hypothetical protein
MQGGQRENTTEEGKPAKKEIPATGVTPATVGAPETVPATAGMPSIVGHPTTAEWSTNNSRMKVQQDNRRAGAQQEC